MKPAMNTFFNLIQDVQKPGLCHRCGGCAAFCTAIGYRALVVDSQGRPAYGNIENCVECGLCYSICPETTDMEEEVRTLAGWTEPMGRVVEITVARSADPRVRRHASDGGAVTALLLHLFDRNKIDGAILSRPMGHFMRQPFLATTRKDIENATGFFPDTAHGLYRFGESMLAYSSIEKLNPMRQKGLSRVAMVAVPCQIKALRKMQALNLVPSDAVQYCFGLFCAGHFSFSKADQQQIARLVGIDWNDVLNIHIKDKFYLTLASGEQRSIELKALDFMKRSACHFCADFSAELADISFGGMGAEAGWSTLMARTPKGRALLADGRSMGSLEQFSVSQNPRFASNALEQVRNAAFAKKKNARYKRRRLKSDPVQVKI